METKRSIEYRIGAAARNAIHAHLRAADAGFTPPLGGQVILDEYARKLHTNAETFEAWHQGTLAGLIACYLNDPQRKRAFLSHVAVLPGFQDRGIAGRLLELCMERARAEGFATLVLEVERTNARAIAFYEKRGFTGSGESGSRLQMVMPLRP